MIPGDNSFTRSLIWALEGLSTESRGFTTSELRQRIVQAPNFPEDQFPTLCQRNGSASLKHIVIAPLSPDSNVSSQAYRDDPHGAIEEYLDLRLLMERKLNPTEVKSLSTFFSDLIRRNELPARRVAFVGQYPRIMEATRAVCYKWRSLTQRRNDLHSVGTPGLDTARVLLSPSPVSRNPDDVLDKASKTAKRQLPFKEGWIRASTRMLLLAIIDRLLTMILRLQNRVSTSIELQCAANVNI